MKKLGLLCGLVFGLATACVSQPGGPNVVLITLDGFRWQELFEGADSVLLNKQVAGNERAGIYWHPDPETRRKILMPFIWSEIVANGQLSGNRNFGNRVDCDNPHWFSYPGYSEMLTGFVDRRIKSNAKIENPNMTVLEYISQQPGFENRVAAFATWGVFPYILRERSSQVPVNAGIDPDVAADTITAKVAIEYMRSEHPRAMFIGLDDTDSYAHAGKYDEYLHAANRSDALIKKVWEFIQSDAFYKNNTTLIITTDHGRGRGYKGDKFNWSNHGRLAFGSGEVWVAAIGPDVPAHGEMKVEIKSTLSQVASTVAAVVGLGYENRREVAEPFLFIVSSKAVAAAK